MGYVYGDSTAGQKTLYRVGMTGIPIFNVNNNCSTGSTALYLARQAVESGAVDCALAVGLRADGAGRADREVSRPADAVRRLRPRDRRAGRHAGRSARDPLFRRRRGSRTCSKYGTKLETFAKIRAKASRHAANNPLALFRKEVSVDDVMASPVLMPGVMTRLMACPPTCGAAAAVVVSEDFATAPRHCPARHHRGAGDDDRHAGHVRRARHDAARRLRHGEGGGERGLRGGGHRPGRRRRRRAARLLRAERAHQLRGARTLRRRRGRALRRRRRQHLWRPLS